MRLVVVDVAWSVCVCVSVSYDRQSLGVYVL